MEILVQCHMIFLHQNLIFVNLIILHKMINLKDILNFHVLELNQKQSQKENYYSIQDDNLMNANLLINQKRYTQKVQSFNEKTFGFSSTPIDIQEQMNRFNQIENTRSSRSN
ncbi:hypothetical protein IMG5_012360 [Ichthyophthirius multifiliis]|uniref:Uncharacterized protein n=1 Tax=Ichthyophthirius multifiliis TaxID=5932 RepID=G0QK37_ICHMU|nr:hypothetical protein IMG5_012360 [Ichthyophthirius multifiliis]EGR34419.1 hypothetical protein IMG5_012360 [Ichthyophthirius multifiliis]|eukprot:XP_004039723.1 hypothetical protein IMG5_012360 [Ichthyophthirius multifiliis]